MAFLPHFDTWALTFKTAPGIEPGTASMPNRHGTTAQQTLARRMPL
jgi:hypothetical protein